MLLFCQTIFPARFGARLQLIDMTIVPTYIYKGDRLTGIDLKGQPCSAVHRSDGKCIRGRNGNMLVQFAGKKVVVPARHLRKAKS